MTTLADSLVSTSARKIPVRVRPDLVARRQRYHGRVYWVVKDPVGLNYFQGRYSTNMPLLMAGASISLVPIVIVYVIFQRQFIKGITAGALK